MHRKPILKITCNCATRRALATPLMTWAGIFGTNLHVKEMTNGFLGQSGAHGGEGGAGRRRNVATFFNLGSAPLSLFCNWHRTIYLLIFEYLHVCFVWFPGVTYLVILWSIGSRMLYIEPVSSFFSYSFFSIYFCFSLNAFTFCNRSVSKIETIRISLFLFFPLSLSLFFFPFPATKPIVFQQTVEPKNTFEEEYLLSIVYTSRLHN